LGCWPDAEAVANCLVDVISRRNELIGAELGDQAGASLLLHVARAAADRCGQQVVERIYRRIGREQRSVDNLFQDCGRNGVIGRATLRECGCSGSDSNWRADQRGDGPLCRKRKVFSRSPGQGCRELDVSFRTTQHLWCLLGDRHGGYNARPDQRHTCGDALLDTSSHDFPSIFGLDLSQPLRGSLGHESIQDKLAEQVRITCTSNGARGLHVVLQPPISTVPTLAQT